MDKEKETTEEMNPRSKELLASIEKSLRKEIEIGKSYGFDVKKHWKEMLESLDEEKAAEEPKRKLITLVSTEGKTAKEISNEVWSNYQKYLSYQADSLKKKTEQTKDKQRGSIIDVTDEGDWDAMIIGL